jgi:hypothetical protein
MSRRGVACDARSAAMEVAAAVKTVSAHPPESPMRIHLLLFFCLFAGSIPAAETSSAAENGEGGASWLSWEKWDELHVTLSGELQSRLTAYDQFFGDERTEEEGQGSQIKLALGPDWSRKDGLGLETRIRTRLSFPRLEERLQLVLDSTVRTEDAFEQSGEIVDNFEKTRPDAALRYFLRSKERFRVSLDGGIRTSSPWQLFTKLRGRYRVPAGMWDLQLSQSFQYFTEDRFLSTSEMRWATPLTEDLLFSSASKLNYSEAREGFIPAQVFQLYHGRSETSAIKFDLSGSWPQTPAQGPDEEADGDAYEFRCTYRTRIRDPWAFLEPYAGVRFEENHDYETDVLCGVLFEAAIGTLK